MRHEVMQLDVPAHRRGTYGSMHGRFVAAYYDRASQQFRSRLVRVAPSERHSFAYGYGAAPYLIPGIRHYATRAACARALTILRKGSE